MDDRRVIEQIRDGDTKVFETLVERYQGPLFGYLGRMGLAPDRVEDLVQESFLRAFRHLHRFDPDRAAFSTWLFTIAKRLALNGLAHQSRQGTDVDVSQLADPSPGVLDRCDDPRIKERIHAAMRQIPIKLRSPIALAYLKDMSLADIALVEGCALGTVKSRIHRGKQRLRVLLADLIDERADQDNIRPGADRASRPENNEEAPSGSPRGGE